MKQQDIPEVNDDRLAMLKVLSIADFTTGTDGLPVSLRDRKKDIQKRYSLASTPVKALSAAWSWLVESYYDLGIGKRGIDCD